MQISFLSEVGKVGPVETRPAVIREGLEWELERAQAWIDNAPKPYPKDAAWGAYFADEHIKNIPQLLAAAESGDLWAAVGYALRIGYNDGRWHMYPQKVRSTRRATELAAWREKIDGERQRAAGRERQKATADGRAWIREETIRRLEADPEAVWTPTCALVLEKYNGIAPTERKIKTVRTIRNYTRDLKHLFRQRGSR